MNVRHPLLDPVVVAIVEREATLDRRAPWRFERFVDLNDRASHPCGTFHGTGRSVFAKASTIGELTTEREGLALLTRLAGVRTPASVADGVVALPDGTGLLLLEALTERAPHESTVDDWRAVGHALAAVHAVRGTQFGHTTNGWFGPLPQDNRPTASDTWAAFYAERRLEPNLRAAVDSGHLPAALAAATTRLIDRLPACGGPEPEPTLLHGDAQQNNIVITPDGPVLIDASPYFGHPEIDLAMVDIFEPAPDELFAGYRERAAIDDGFFGRRELWRVFAYLAVIAVDGAHPFGRSFVPRLAAALADR